MMAGTQRDDFDRSFDLFEKQVDVSQDTQQSNWTASNSANPNDTSFDTDIFTFTVESSSQLGGPIGGFENDSQASSVFPPDPFATPFMNEQPQIAAANVDNLGQKLTPGSQQMPSKVETIQVAVHEQLSALYDDVSSEPSFHVDGSIFVKAKSQLAGAPFCITVRDLMGNLEEITSLDESTQEISDEISRQGLHRSDRVLRVLFPQEDTSRGDRSNAGVRIASYTCSPTLRPVPLVR